MPIPASATSSEIPTPLKVEQHGPVLMIGLDRPAKRNALNEAMIQGLRQCFFDLPDDVRAIVLHGIGEHFSAGLDLSELKDLDASAGLAHSMRWHRVFDEIQYSRVPVIAALSGAVIGGGLELACAAHLRVADATAFYALPEGQRGIFVGGGGSVRLPRLIGVSKMADLMLTGRIYSAAEGMSVGITEYLTEPGEALAKAMELAERVARNAPMTNFAVLQALPLIAEAQPQTGMMMESLMAAVTQSDNDAKARIRSFLDHKAAKVRPV